MKKNILFFILGLVIAGSIGVYATIKIQADEIGYTDLNNNEITVDTALNNLYTTQNTTVSSLNEQLTTCNTNLSKYDKLNFVFTAENPTSTVGVGGTITFSGFRQKYRYFEIKNKNMRSGCTSCEFSLHNFEDTVELNHKYNTADHNYLIVTAIGAPCDVTIEFSN